MGIGYLQKGSFALCRWAGFLGSLFCLPPASLLRGTGYLHPHQTQLGKVNMAASKLAEALKLLCFHLSYPSGVCEPGPDVTPTVGDSVYWVGVGFSFPAVH